jgi:hypothetical protein
MTPAAAEAFNKVRREKRIDRLPDLFLAIPNCCETTLSAGHSGPRHWSASYDGPVKRF